MSFAVIVSDSVSLVLYLVASGMFCLLTVPIRALGENVEVCWWEDLRLLLRKEPSGSGVPEHHVFFFLS